MRVSSGLVAVALLLVVFAGAPLLAGAQCVDYADQMRWITHLGTDDHAEDVAVWGDIACVVGQFGLIMADVANPESPQVLGQATVPGYPYGVAMQDGLACVASAAVGLLVFDVTDPASPTLVGSFDTPGNAQDVALDGALAFVADGWSGLAVIDIADPPNAQLIQTSTEYRNFVGVAAAHGHVFAADPTVGLVVYDARSVATEPPEMVGSMDLGAANVAVTGFTALTASGHFGMSLYDVSSLQTPQPISQLPVDGDTKAVAVVGEVAYVAARDGGLVTVDLSDPLAPVVLGQVESYDLPIDIAVANGYAYISNYHDDRALRIVDVSDSTQLVVMSKMPCPSGPSGAVAGLAVSGDHAYLAMTTAGLAVVDISDPSSPTVTGIVDTPGNATAVAVAGSYAYVIERSIPGLRIIDVSDPSNPQLVASVATNYYAEDVEVHGTLVYVANGNDGLLIVDVSDPRMPQVVGSLGLLGRSTRITVADGMAYVLSSPSGYTSMQVVDVTDPATPTIVGYADTDAVLGLALSSTEVVLAGGTAGVTLLPRHCQTTVGVTTTVATSSLRAYPNPTSSTTSLRFRAATAGPIQAVVYDVAGRQVRELASEFVDAGPHELHWNGRDERGRPVAAGTYLVRVVAGRQTYSSSILLLR